MSGMQILETSGSLETGPSVSLIQADLEEALRVKQQELQVVEVELLVKEKLLVEEKLLVKVEEELLGE